MLKRGSLCALPRPGDKNSMGGKLCHDTGRIGIFSSSASCLRTFGDVDSRHEEFEPPTLRPLDDPLSQLSHLPSLVSRSKMLSAGSPPDGDGINPEDFKIRHPAWHTHQVRMSWVTGACCTFSLGRRLMVLSGRSTRRTLRDLMVLMSLPFVPLRRWKV